MKSNFGVIYYENSQKRYEGELNNNIPHGEGIEYYENGRTRYIGSWKNGKKQKGRCIEYYNNNLIYYEGEIENYEFHGKGIEYYGNGKIHYAGAWKNGKYHGQGELYNDEGKKIYEGQWLNNNKEGHGILYNQNNKIIYDGNFFNNKKHGKGIEYYENGNKHYEGQFKEGIPHGQGIVYYQNGKKWYEGELKNGKKDGKGTFYHKDKYEEYTGFFKDGKKVDKQSIKTTSNFIPNTAKIENITTTEQQFNSRAEIDDDALVKRYYDILSAVETTKKKLDLLIQTKEHIKENEFTSLYKLYTLFLDKHALELKQISNEINRRKHIQQKIKLSEVNEQSYKNTNQNIPSKIIKSNIGILYYENGNKYYEGELNYNIPHGKGIKYYENGNKHYDGEFKDGKPHGKGIVYYQNGNKYYIGELQNGEKNGWGILYYENGKIEYEGQWLNDKPHEKTELNNNNIKHELQNAKSNNDKSIIKILIGSLLICGGLFLIWLLAKWIFSHFKLICLTIGGFIGIIISFFIFQYIFYKLTKTKEISVFLSIISIIACFYLIRGMNKEDTQQNYKQNQNIELKETYTKPNLINQANEICKLLENEYGAITTGNQLAKFCGSKVFTEPSEDEISEFIKKQLIIYNNKNETMDAIVAYCAFALFEAQIEGQYEQLKVLSIMFEASDINFCEVMNKMSENMLQKIIDILRNNN